MCILDWVDQRLSGVCGCLQYKDEEDTGITDHVNPDRAVIYCLRTYTIVHVQLTRSTATKTCWETACNASTLPSMRALARASPAVTSKGSHAATRAWRESSRPALPAWTALPKAMTWCACARRVRTAVSVSSSFAGMTWWTPVRPTPAVASLCRIPPNHNVVEKGRENCSSQVN